jgi:hypothetical protein
VTNRDSLHPASGRQALKEILLCISRVMIVRQESVNGLNGCTHPLRILTRACTKQVLKISFQFENSFSLPCSQRIRSRSQYFTEFTNNPFTFLCSITSQYLHSCSQRLKLIDYTHTYYIPQLNYSQRTLSCPIITKNIAPIITKIVLHLGSQIV